MISEVVRPKQSTINNWYRDAMRKAFIGLSTPIGYNYNFETATTKPNAVLDSPLGLFLFYDELWFLSRSVCPINCQRLKYVHFLDEEYNLSKIGLKDYVNHEKNIEKLIWSSPHELKIPWQEVIQSNLGNTRKPIDNHGRSNNIGNLSFTPNPTGYNLMIDDYIAATFGLELITSTITNQISNNNIVQELASKLTQVLLCENIPNFQLDEGPYHPFIEDLRTDKLLHSYRKKIKEVVEENDADSVFALKQQLSNQMDIYKNELVMKNLSKTRIYKSAVDVAVSQIPLMSNIYSMIDHLRTSYGFISDRKKHGWVGFVIKSKSIIKQN